MGRGGIFEDFRVPSNYTQDEFAILHEYGHLVDYKWARPWVLPMMGECPSDHSFCAKPKDGTKCAMKEGWAHFFSCLARNSSKYWEGYDNELWLPDFEHPFNHCNNFLSKSQDNEMCEIMVAAILWDLYDPVNNTEFDEIQIPPNELVPLILDSMWSMSTVYGSKGLETFYTNFNIEYKDTTDLPGNFDTLLIDGYGIDYRYLKSKSIEASITCPANLHAYDSEGRHVGLNESGGIDLEIPYSYYTGLDSDPERIGIPSKLEGKWGII